MHQKMSNIMRFLKVPAICLFFVLSTGAAAWADDDRQRTDDGKQPERQLSTQKETLKKKSSTMVGTATGRQYRINSKTLVVGEDGRQVMIKYLLVPCQVELIYETRTDGALFAHRIKVLSTQPDATNRMWEKPN